MYEYENDILKEREKQYGDPMEMHNRISWLWSGILNTEVSAYQVALCMAALKLARATRNPSDPDSLIDVHGYVEIAKLIQDKQNASVESEAVSDKTTKAQHNSTRATSVVTVLLAVPRYMSRNDDYQLVDPFTDETVPVLSRTFDRDLTVDDVNTHLESMIGKFEYINDTTEVKTITGDIWTWMVFDSICHSDETR